jgi:hypothetical protein
MIRASGKGGPDIPTRMITGLTWKAETKALSKIKQSADKRLGLTLDAQHGHVSPSQPRSPPSPP